MEPNDMPPNNQQHATLGCGTLILIALIVIIFSGSGVSDLERDVDRLRKEVDGLKSTIATQTGEITQLRAVIDQQTKMLKALPVRPEQE